ncbi:MAG: hypothetical protein IJR14_00115 [Synergistaceae bacterium]|nr:hypothetical protein [Synergistaceae bacterium]
MVDAQQEDLREAVEAEQAQRAEELYSSLFGDGTEAEQLRVRRLSTELGIKDNDAIWIIIYVLNYFGRFYNDLPEKLKGASEACLEDVRKASGAIAEAEARKAQGLFEEALGKSIQQILARYERRAWLYDLLLPLAWTCVGVFALCLVSFVGGAAVAGKGWGQTPLTALLAAPAGHILPLALLPVAAFALYRGLVETGRTRALALLAAGLLAVLAFGALAFSLGGA